VLEYYSTNFEGTTELTSSGQSIKLEDRALFITYDTKVRV